ncbi:MAG TPA: DUF6483 family protein [Verrucomicrobiae bacterium]|jgi:hypothetical protein|nr:DUF6483 family protein [Verrucomicrobiae bacterium]
MIRRDYILRMLAEFFEVLSRIRALQKGQQWSEASRLTGEQISGLIGIDPRAALGLSETELLARLIKSESTLAVREKTLMLATLFKEAGDTASTSGNPDEGMAYYLKGLHLMLGLLAREDPFEFPEFVPRIEGFLSALGGAPLPLLTRGMLMQHYEGIGDFGRAEDTLFSMIEDDEDNPELLEFGIAFYHRLQKQPDDALINGNLPRNELETGISELLKRKAARSSAFRP